MKPDVHGENIPPTEQPKREEHPAFEELLPSDLPILEEGLGESSEVELSPAARALEIDRARRLVARPPATAMLERASRLMRFIGQLLFAHVLFEKRSIESIRDANKRGTVVYVMKSESRLDFSYFNHAFLKHDLPLAKISNGPGLRPFRRFFGALLRWIRRQPYQPERDMQALVRQGESAMIFLEKPRQNQEEAHEFSQPFLFRLIRTQKEVAEPIFVIPLLLVWEKRPDPKRASFLDDIFGTVQSPGFFRKFIHYFQTFWQSFLRFGQPMVQVSTAIDLQGFLREYPHADSSDSSELLRSRLEEFIRQERHVIVGPTTQPREAIHRQVLLRPELVDTIKLIAEKEGIDEEVVRIRARKQLEEISADPSLLMLKFFSATLSFVWYRIYEGFEVDEEGLERVRQAARSSSIVLVPSHKSHIDYLVLSYLFYHYGLMCPHIAAGVNLSFWPMGPIFRRAGAFFIRRSFKGDDLYPVVFREYLIRLMEESYPIEFFIEGTRSRTGKLIKPKYGMLEMMVRAFASGRLESVKLVPISVGYEKIIEERSYRRELLGEEKQRESLAGLLKTPKFLTSKKGRLYVEFDEPIDLEDYFQRYSIDRLEPDEEELNNLTVRLAHRLIYDINKITTVSPSAVTALVLLNTPARGLERDQLLHEVGFVLHFLRSSEQKVRISGALREALAARSHGIDVLRDAQNNPSPTLYFDPTADRNDLEAQHVEALMGSAVGEVVDRALAIFEKEGQVQIREEGGSTFYALEEDHRLELAYYRNTMIQHFVPQGLLATAILSFDEKDIDLEALRKETRFLSRLFKYEWIYEERAEFDNVFSRTLQTFQDSNWVEFQTNEHGETRVSIVGEGLELSYFRRIVLTFLEAYAIVVSLLPQLQEGRIESRDFVRRAIEAGHKGYLRGQVLFYESISKPTFVNALKLLEDWEALSRESEPGRVRETIFYAAAPGWAPEDAYRLQKRIDNFVYRDWDLRNRIHRP